MTLRLRTERATIRPWRADEGEVLLDIRQRPDVATWLSDPEPWTDLAQARAQIDKWQERATTAIPLTCAIVPHDTRVPVGSVSMNQMPEPGAGDVSLSEAPWVSELGLGDGAPREVGIGWYLHPDAVGHGWATEAAAAMLAHGLARHRRIWAVMWSHNEPSAAVCRRIGMAELGVRVDPWYGSAEDGTSRFFVATQS